MNRGRIVAAEEIQLLLPENQPGAEQGGRALLLGLALLCLAVPCWTLCGAGQRTRFQIGAAHVS